VVPNDTTAGPRTPHSRSPNTRTGGLHPRVYSKYAGQCDGNPHSTRSPSLSQTAGQTRKTTKNENTTNTVNGIVPVSGYSFCVTPSNQSYTVKRTDSSNPPKEALDRLRLASLLIYGFQPQSEMVIKSWPTMNSPPNRPDEAVQSDCGAFAGTR
jgi:hypothetical protein